MKFKMKTGKISIKKDGGEVSIEPIEIETECTVEEIIGQIGLINKLLSELNSTGYCKCNTEEEIKREVK